jgi:hypothetical protein
VWHLASALGINRTVLFENRLYFSGTSISPYDKKRPPRLELGLVILGIGFGNANIGESAYPEAACSAHGGADCGCEYTGPHDNTNTRYEARGRCTDNTTNYCSGCRRLFLVALTCRCFPNIARCVVGNDGNVIVIKSGLVQSLNGPIGFFPFCEDSHHDIVCTCHRSYSSSFPVSAWWTVADAQVVLCEQWTGY